MRKGEKMARKQSQILRVAIAVAVFAIVRPVCAGPLLWPLQVGLHYEMTQSNALGDTWTVQGDVDKRVTFNSVEYFRLRVWNYEKEPGVRSLYLRPTEDAVYQYNPGGPERLLVQKAPVGTRWYYAEEDDEYPYRVVEISGIEAVTVPYGTFNEAYIHRNYRCVDPANLDLGKTPDWYNWIVPGVGMVKEVDNWADNPPVTNELVVLTGVPASFTYNSTEALHIWDITGQHGSGDETFNLVEDAKGKLTGTGELHFTTGEDIAVDATYTITGQITQTAGVGNVKATLRAKGTATRGGETSKFTGTKIWRAHIDPATSTLSGTEKRSMTAFGDHDSATDDIEEVLADGMDGTFTLTVDITPSGKKATGTAVLTLSNGDVYNFSGKGTFNAKHDQYLLTLKSPEKLSLKLYIKASTGEITKLTGKALGQNLRAANIPVATP
jgi:hypothetical protein